MEFNEGAHKGPCPYEGSRKVTSGEYTTPLLCEAHAQEWMKGRPGWLVVKPRQMIAGDYPCTADWALFGEIP